jgi:hypothetical protein
MERFQALHDVSSGREWDGEYKMGGTRTRLSAKVGMICLAKAGLTEDLYVL